MPTITLTDGSFYLPLTYNASNQHKYRMQYGGRLTPTEPTPIWHQSPEYPPELIDLINQNRIGFYDVVVDNDGGDNKDDDVQNSLAALRRWVDGADQQAARFWVLDDVSRITLLTQRDDSTVVTAHPVIYGFVDDGTAHYDEFSVNNNIALPAVVGLTLAPAGEAENPILLHNDLKNAAFWFESSTSGLAANWNANGSPTLTLDTAVYLLGGRSQKVVATGGGEGVDSDNLSASVTSAYGYAWVHVESGSVHVRLRDTVDGIDRSSLVIDSTDSGGVSDKKYVDAGGRTWWRVPISSTNMTPVYNHVVRIRSHMAAATFYIGAAYLEMGGTSTPNAWCSTSAITNRNDQSTSNPGRVNYIDVWGVPGDVSAIVDHTLTGTVTGANGEQVILATYKDKRDQLAADFVHWVEAEDFTVDGAISGSWSIVADGNASGGNVHRFTGSGIGALGSIKYTVPYITKPLIVYVRAKASVSTINMTLANVSSGSPSPILQSDTVTLDTSYQFHKVGVIQLESPPSSGQTSGIFAVAVSNVGNTEMADIDCVFFVPILDGQLLAKTTLLTGSMNGTDLVISGNDEAVYTTYRADAIGFYPTIRPGGTVTRFYYNRLSYVGPGTDPHDLTDTFDVRLTVLPRTRHLMGTS